MRAMAPFTLLLAIVLGGSLAAAPRAAAALNDAEIAQTDFDRKLYGRCLERLARWEGEHGTLSVELELLRARAVLRKALVGQTGSPEDEDIDRLLDLLEDGEFDELRAAASRDLFDLERFGHQAARIRALLLRARAFWEGHLEPQRVLPQYREYFEAALGRRGVSGSSPDELAKMWNNLVSAGLDRSEIPRLARLVFFGPDTEAGRRLRVPPRGYADALSLAVARSILTRFAPDDQSDDLEVYARLTVAFDAEGRKDARTAVENLEWLQARMASLPTRIQRVVQDRLAHWKNSFAQLEGADRYRPGSEHAVDLSWRNAREWRLTVDRLRPIEDLRAPKAQRAGHVPESWQDLTALYADSPGREVYREQYVDDRETRARAEQSHEQPHQLHTRRVWIDPLPKGLYRVRLSTVGYDDRGAQDEFLMRVSTLGMQLRSLGDQLQGPLRPSLWVVDTASGRSVAGAEGVVLAYRTDPSVDVQRREYRASRSSFSTDGQGISRFDLPNLSHRDGIAVVAEFKGEPVLGFRAGAPESKLLDSDLRYAGFVWTDRPIYRPGETVHLQVAWRALRDLVRDLDVPRGMTVQIEVTNPLREAVLHREVNLDENGTADIDFELNEEVPLGAYRVRVRGGDPEATAFATLHVEEVRWPEFEVRVSIDTGARPVLGDSLDVRVDAHYLFGAAVEGTAVVEVSRRPRWRFWQPPRRWQAAPALDRIVLPPGPGRGQPVAREELSLDAEGRAQLRIATEGQSAGQGWEYVVTATVTDLARRTERGSASVALGREGLRPYLHATRNVVAPGETAQMSLHVEDNLGGTDEVEVAWTLLRRSDEGWDAAASGAVVTDSTGNAELAIRIDQAGVYRIDARVEDGRGGRAHATSDLWCASAKVRSLEGFDGGLRLVAAESPTPGNVARVLLLNDAPGTDVMVTRAFAGGASAEVLRMNGTARWIEIPLSSRERPRLMLDAVRAHDTQWQATQLVVECPQPARRLDLELSFADAIAKPGERVPLSLTARDGDGNPVRTIFALAVVDDAVLAVRGRENSEAVHGFCRFQDPRLPVLRELITPGGRGIRNLTHEDRVADSSTPTKHAGGLGVDSPRRPELARGGRVEELASADAMKLQSGREMPSASPGASDAVVLREDFRATALWRTGIRTDADGRATVEVPLASTLTRWNALVVAVDGESRTGLAEAEVRTRLPLMVQLEHPRVLRARDVVGVAAIVHNDSDQDTRVQVQLEAPDLDLADPTREIDVAAHSQTRVEWEAAVDTDSAVPVLQRDARGRPVDVVPSMTSLTVTVRSSSASDAVAHQVPLQPAGSPLRVVGHTFLDGREAPRAGGGARPRLRSTIRWTLPADRLPGSDVLLAHVTPSVLGGCVQALPYLAEFPQGCTEQTLSRFVPAVAVSAVAQRLGFDARRVDPELRDKIAKGLSRIRKLANPGGGWPWWKGGPDNFYMTAYAVRSLALAHEYGVEQAGPLLESARRRLAQMYEGTERADDRAYALHALALAARQLDESWAWAPSGMLATSLDLLFDARDELSASSRALLAVAEEYRGNHARAVRLVEHLENDLHRLEDGSIHWGDLRASWRGKNPVEATAFVLEALVLIDPQSSWRDGAARWLMLNREGRRWHSTRETAHAVLALVRHAESSETRDAMQGSVVFRSGGRELGRLELDLDAVLEGRLSVELDEGELRDGPNSVDVEFDGAGPLWASIEANTFTRQRKLPASQGDLEISRQVFELRPVRTLGGWIAREEIALDDARLESGDRVRVKLALHAVHDLDFVRIQDPRAGGVESLERLSGPHASGGLWARRELGEDRTEFFLDHLPAGDHELIYEFVVERPGRYRVEPARMEGMYLPLRAANSSSLVFDIES